MRVSCLVTTGIHVVTNRSVPDWAGGSKLTCSQLLIKRMWLGIVGSLHKIITPTVPFHPRSNTPPHFNFLVSYWCRCTQLAAATCSLLESIQILDNHKVQPWLLCHILRKLCLFWVLWMFWVAQTHYLLVDSNVCKAKELSSLQAIYQ